MIDSGRFEGNCLKYQSKTRATDGNVAKFNGS